MARLQRLLANPSTPEGALRSINHLITRVQGSAKRLGPKLRRGTTLLQEAAPAAITSPESHGINPQQLLLMQLPERPGLPSRPTRPGRPGRAGAGAQQRGVPQGEPSAEAEGEATKLEACTTHALNGFDIAGGRPLKIACSNSPGFGVRVRAEIL